MVSLLFRHASIYTRVVGLFTKPSSRRSIHSAHESSVYSLSQRVVGLFTQPTSHQRIHSVHESSVYSLLNPRIVGVFTQNMHPANTKDAADSHAQPPSHCILPIPRMRLILTHSRLVTASCQYQGADSQAQQYSRCILPIPRMRLILKPSRLVAASCQYQGCG